MVVQLFATILAGVPAERAGVASGALTTTQQVALSLGVAAVGSLFFMVAQHHGYGPATVTVTLIEAALTLAAVALMTLPRPR